jgi:hypothetical protein
MLLDRAYEDSRVHPDKLGAPLVLGTIGFLTYATTANPTAEALSSTTDAVAGHVFEENAIGCTVSLSAGTIAVPRNGVYMLRLELTNVTAASNSGVFAFSLQKNAAALTNVKTIGWTNAAAVLPGVHGSCTARVSLAKGDLIRAVITGSVGGVITIGNGSLCVQMLGDNLSNVSVP